MKKRLLIFVGIVIILGCFLTGCELAKDEGVVDNGNYSIYYSSSNEKYLEFLKNLNSNCEILNISKDNFYWYVTYIEENE